jgi:hypothetical protein
MKRKEGFELLWPYPPSVGAASQKMARSPLSATTKSWRGSPPPAPPCIIAAGGGICLRSGLVRASEMREVGGGPRRAFCIAHPGRRAVVCLTTRPSSFGGAFGV